MCGWVGVGRWIVDPFRFNRTTLALYDGGILITRHHARYQYNRHMSAFALSVDPDRLTNKLDHINL